MRMRVRRVGTRLRVGDRRHRVGGDAGAARAGARAVRRPELERVLPLLRVGQAAARARVAPLAMRVRRQLERRVRVGVGAVGGREQRLVGGRLGLAAERVAEELGERELAAGGALERRGRARQRARAGARAGRRVAHAVVVCRVLVGRRAGHRRRVLRRVDRTDGARGRRARALRVDAQRVRELTARALVSRRVGHRQRVRRSAGGRLPPRDGRRVRVRVGRGGCGGGGGGGCGCGGGGNGGQGGRHDERVPDARRRRRGQSARRRRVLLLRRNARRDRSHVVGAGAGAVLLERSAPQAAFRGHRQRGIHCHSRARHTAAQTQHNTTTRYVRYVRQYSKCT